MCGVIGISLSKVGDNDIALIENVFKQTQIRGKHATGVSYVQDGLIKTIREPIPVSEFLEKYSPSDWVNEDGGIYLIGHARYSTSDLRFNQPLFSDTVSIVHNGVISQEPPSEWKYKTETYNDSELVLKSLENGKHPFQDFPNSSMSVCSLSVDKTLRCFRNHERPLWFSKIPSGYVFTSTRDIAIRSGIDLPVKTLMYTEYVVDKNGMKMYNYLEELNYESEDLQ